jgi:GNAT superfamily N-acetyltransferase
VTCAFIVARSASADATALTRIALAAKRHWGYPEHWMARWTPVLTITPDFIEANSVYAARLGGEIAGFYALQFKEGLWWLEHLWVLPEHMGHGLGRALYEHALRTAAALGAAQLEIEADLNAEAFYLRMGARRIGENVTELNGQPRVLPLLRVRLTAES